MPGEAPQRTSCAQVSYYLGMQDGKARALNAAMIDDDFYVHQILRLPEDITHRKYTKRILREQKNTHVSLVCGTCLR